MDSTNLCNALRMEFEGVFESKIPLDAFPAKIQDMILALARQENYSIEYMMASLLVAVSTAIGNAVNIRIRGGWISNPALYMILVGRPGMGKTPPLDFAFRPIRKHDAKIIKQFKLDMEHYNSLIENNKVKKDKSSSLPDKPVLRRIIISDFTPEALMRALDDNQRGVVVYVDEIMGMFNAVNQYSKGQLIEQLLTAFSGKPLDVSRCSIPVPIHIEHPFINIVGTMQTTRMHELIEKGYKDNGLIDRIIFVYPSSQEISDWGLDEDSSVSTFGKYSSMCTPTTNTAASTQPDSTLWKNLLTAIGEVATAQKSTISLRAVSGLNSMPTGFCIHALATRIHQAEIVAPSPVSQVDARWKRLLTLSQPKNMTAINVASIKKAKIPSMASGAPKISPTNQL